MQSPEAVEIIKILDRARDTLVTAKAGLKMMEAINATEQNVGLRNVIVFGRSVTFVLQNLKGKHPMFDPWYATHTEKMKSDPVFSFFRDVRNEVLKEGRLDLGTAVTIHHFDPSTMARLQSSRPLGATAFFIGDHLGGSGWEVTLIDGATEKFYVELPADVGQVSQFFVGNLADKWLKGDVRSSHELAVYYLKVLESLVADAKAIFTE